MKKLLIGTFILAFSSGVCCLGSLIFIVFGVSISALNTLEVLAPFRFLLVALSVICYIFFIYKIIKRQACFSKHCNKGLIFFGILLFLILFYPEIIGFLI